MKKSSNRNVSMNLSHKLSYEQSGRSHSNNKSASSQWAIFAPDKPQVIIKQKHEPGSKTHRPKCDISDSSFDCWPQTSVSPHRQHKPQTSLISRNVSQRSSSSTFVKVKAADFCDKEKKQYNEKIKLLKSENRKLLSLLKDSEKVFFNKLQEAKRETQNLNNVIK